MFLSQVVSVAVLLAVSTANPTTDDICTVTNFNNVKAAAARCLNLVINGIAVPAGQELTLNLRNGATLTFQGHTTFGFKNWKGPLVDIRGRNVTVKGAIGHRLDGQGQLYWDGKGAQGSLKPTFIHISTTGQSFLHDINVLNCPQRCVSVNSQDTIFDKWNIDVSLGDTRGGHNTDGFDISLSRNVHFSNCIVKNQDDCVAVNQGSDLFFDGFTCFGSHGLSLSVGQSTGSGTPNTVQNVQFTNSKLFNSDNGIHVKTHPKAGLGLVSKVLYRNIEIHNIKKNGISVEQDYGDKGNLRSNIPILGLTMTNITGNMATNKAKNIYIACAPGGCNGWIWNDIKISGGTKECRNYRPNGISC